MLAEDIYHTIAGPSEGLYKEKGSKFLAYAWPVESEEAIKEHVSELKTRYYDARHHCYAWQLGTDGMNFRANDDGEPSGTAGKPIHGQIRSHELTNVLIVVVRYFGGTKLGTSGLIHAYKTAAADALAQAVVVEKTVNTQFTLRFPYEAMNDVMRVVKEEEPQIIEQSFDLSCVMTLVIRLSQAEQLRSRLEKIDYLTLDD